METLEQKKRRLFGKINLNNYLKELNLLTNVEITEGMLLSLSETDQINVVNKEHSYKSTILFNEKLKLSKFILNLIKVKDDECYLYTAYSSECGMLRLSSLKDFNSNFQFFDEHSGLLTIILKDLSNELILDYYENNNEYYLDLETYGKEWSKVRIK